MGMEPPTFQTVADQLYLKKPSSGKEKKKAFLNSTQLQAERYSRRLRSIMFVP